MDSEQRQFLTLALLPSRLTAEQAGWVLGFQKHEVSILISAGLLKPLGHPAANAPKYFSTLDLNRLKEDVKWLSRATDAIHDYWKGGNGKKLHRESDTDRAA